MTRLYTAVGFARCLALGLFFPLILQTSGSQAQTTLESVTAILNTGCTFSSCHDASSPAANLNLSGSAFDIYNVLVGQTPTNPQAAARGYKRVDPGSPETSFLMHKVARDAWDDYYPLGTGEGSQMPTSSDLAHEDIELIRQWIQFGAPLTGTVVDPVILDNYYNVAGLPKLERPAAPAEGEGIQVRLGTLFLEPGGEVEYFYKKEVNFVDSTEVTRSQVFFNDESHHFILYQYPNLFTANSYRDGLRELDEFGGAPNDDVQIVAAWQDPLNIPLPEGAAYFWGPQETLDMNFHIYNDNMDSVLAADVYVNIYTRPRDATQPTVEMFSQILPIDIIPALSGTGFVGQSLVIPGDGSEYTFTDDIYFPVVDPPTWNLWYLSSHTHSRGVDYDIFLRNNLEQIFEGFSNIDHTFNQGFYDWEHPPVRIFDELLPVEMGLLGGFRHTAKYINNTGSTLTWGDRTTDEMMLFFIQYTEKPLPVGTGGLEQTVANETLLASMTLTPNPASVVARLGFYLPQPGAVSVRVFDALGRLVDAPWQSQVRPAGHQVLGLATATWPAGTYTVLLETATGRAQRQLVRIP